MIYLDNWGHLFSSRNVVELREFAIKIRLNIRWNHYSRGFPHFDLFGHLPETAVRKGAKLINVRSDEWRNLVDRMEQVTFSKFWHVTYAKKYCYQGYGKLGQSLFRLRLDRF